MPHTKYLFYVFFFGLVIQISACATIITGSNQSVTFSSNPDDATVILNGRTLGKTPITVSLKKEPGQVLVFEKEGYKPLTMQLETRMNPWFWGNIIIGGLVGSTTDGLSGAVHEYSPSQYLVTLQPAGTGSLESQTALSEQQKTKEFIVTNYDNILKDLQRGEGEYVSSLLSLLSVSADRGDVIKRTRALSEAYPNVVDFADHVIKAFGDVREGK